MPVDAVIVQGHPSHAIAMGQSRHEIAMDQTRVPALFPIIARGDLFAPIIAIRRDETDAADRAQRLLRGEGAGIAMEWRRLSDAIVGRRRMGLRWLRAVVSYRL